ncbi:M28 family peptidase [Alteromonas sp. ASW11-36]|uniref:M28 family peptidase n=1 Tax=Alteromonas arenosi TaxID=3055817 RepID=A0ABT7SZR8_9ALTE|nr:M28 family peptidase [Alteromonas sp. ASW11-36]MDM7861499.1 M28 family peptidase [Alteromonas sp. ASW11-36]
MPDQLVADFAYLADASLEGRKPGTNGSLAAQEYIAQRYREADLLVATGGNDYRHAFDNDRTIGRQFGVNLIGHRQAELTQIIVITAHYDHIGKISGRIHPGADDNASGVAVLLSLARRTQLSPLSHQILFVATDSEEKGLHGAKALLADFPGDVEQVVYNLNLDMLARVGRPARLYLTGINTHTAFTGIVEQLNEQLLQDSALRLIKEHRQPRGRRSVSQQINYKNASDHAVFADHGIPYLFFGVGGHNDYHTPRDTFERVEVDLFIEVEALAWALLLATDQRLQSE